MKNWICSSFDLSSLWWWCFYLQSIAPMRKKALDSVYYHQITSKLYKQICTCTCLYSIIFAFTMVRHDFTCLLALNYNTLSFYWFTLRWSNLLFIFIYIKTQKPEGACLLASLFKDKIFIIIFTIYVQILKKFSTL